MALSADKIIELYKKGLADGSIATMEPLLSLFMLDNNPMSLIGREPMLPLFKTERPKRTTLQAGRQVSKSMNLGALSVLGAGFGGMQIAIFEPRFVQKRAINTQVISPLLRNCVVSDKLIRTSNIDPMDVKKFLSGGNIFIVNAFKSGDGGRGIGGCGMVMLDECLQRDSNVFVFDFELADWVNKKIFEIKAGDILKSFSDGAILCSVVLRDASYRGCRPCYKVVTRSGRELICTENHLLPTNNGKQRLSEVIEDAYRLHKNRRRSSDAKEACGDCAKRELFNASTECDYRLADGGWVHFQTSDCDSRRAYAVESKLETARVQFTQAPAIIRARYERTCEEEESRLRRLLVDIDPEVFSNFALVVRDDASEQLQREDNYGKAADYDNSSSGAGLVVYGRRIETDRSELRPNSDEFIHLGRESATAKLAEGTLGSSCECAQSISQQYQQRGLHTVFSEEVVYTAIGDDIGIRSGVDEIQSGVVEGELRTLQCGDDQVSTQVLLPSMRSGLPTDAQKRADRRAEIAEKREEPTVEGCKSGACTRYCKGVLSEYVSRASREAGATIESLSREESGYNKPEKTRMAGCAQGRSCIQSQESSGRSSISREAETGSGETGCVQGEEVRVPESARQDSGSTCPSDGASADKKAEGSGKSGRTRKDSGKGSADCREERSGLERRAPLGGAGEGSRESPSLSSESSSRSGEGCESPRICTRIRSQESRCAYTGGAGSAECQGSRASSEESISRGSCTEEPWTVQAEKESDTIRGNSARTLLTPQPATYSYDPIVSIEYVGYDDVYDIEVVGTHNYILANGICSYNCQDMLPSNIPVLEAVADAKVDTGFRIYSGTAKTIDGTLAMKFEQSSQGHWCVKCECGKYNIFAPEEQLFNTIRDEGCSCAFCSRILDCASGGYVHKFPSRIFEHPGYHLPQIIFPFHHTPNAWKEIIYKKNNIPKTQFYNEVLGVSDSDSVRLLTKAELLAARNNVKSKEQGVALRGHYDLVVLGVDWGGGGGGESATGMAVIAKSFSNNHFETLYLRRLPTGLSPEQEAGIVDSVASEFRVDIIAHDYTGAGFMREAFFVQAYPEWRSALFPVSYSFKPNADLVTSSNSGSRASYIVDKSKSLLLTMGCIKHGVLTVPWFDPLDAGAPQLDFLAIVEHKNKLEDVEGNVVQRRSEVYLLDKVAGVRDDAAQAANIGFIAACHTLGQYPVITYDSKFDISEEQRKLLLGE